MRVLNAWEPDYVYRKTPAERGNPSEYSPKSADPGNKFLRVQMRVEREAQDDDNQHRFTLFQVRLVGDRGDDRPERRGFHELYRWDAGHRVRQIFAYIRREAREKQVTDREVLKSRADDVEVVVESEDAPPPAVDEPPPAE